MNARVFTNQMWTDGQLTKTNPKTSPEQSVKTIFQLIREINKTNAKNVTSITDRPTDQQTNRQTGKKQYVPHYYSFSTTPTADSGLRTADDELAMTIAQVFSENSLANKTTLFTKFHDDLAKNVTSRVHVIQLTQTIFELNSCIKETNVLTKFNENWAKNVTSRVFTCFQYIHIEKNALPTGSHVFSPIWTIKNSSEISIKSMKTAPPTGGHVFQRTRTTFELNQHIIKTSILTKFHEDWAWNVTSTVLTSFELDRDIIGSKLLTKFHEDRKRNVTSRVFTNKSHLSNQTAMQAENNELLTGLTKLDRLLEDTGAGKRTQVQRTQIAG
ncbi:hypothetical protein DPMN_055806 [Dreissena polymorpha]|uniref:Uncharacterized protein n=1 Tax=Dreissena polymorpha TaxID=45954 RepID=A0A9D4CQL4_DREPO|nr:hypothetical protein DPMN_055806 [Dreissena polymorpha]